MATKGMTEHKVVLTLPEIGLTKPQINTLKKNFKNEVVTHLGGAEALAARRIVVVIIVIIIFVDAKR
jgi:hypothetical protein